LLENCAVWVIHFIASSQNFYFLFLMQKQISFLALLPLFYSQLSFCNYKFILPK